MVVHKKLYRKLNLALLGLRTLNGRRKVPVDDHTWFELQFRPRESLKYLGIRIPGFPPDEVQLRFTGRHGRNNLQQAFSFYRHVRSVCGLPRVNDPKILDFGGGWGRIVRFFLRDTKPEFIWIADCLSDSIHWLKETANPCNIVQNEPLPPIADLETIRFDLIYCFSVFSHLNEEYFNAWLTYLLDKLHPGGHLVFTTRGRQFMGHLEYLKGKKGDLSSMEKSLLGKLPDPARIRALYAKDEFQFYPTGGGGELESDFYGEALIPRGYIEKNYGSELLDFTENIKDVDQAVIVLRKGSE